MEEKEKKTAEKLAAQHREACEAVELEKRALTEKEKELEKEKAKLRKSSGPVSPTFFSSLLSPSRKATPPTAKKESTTPAISPTTSMKKTPKNRSHVDAVDAKKAKVENNASATMGAGFLQSVKKATSAGVLGVGQYAHSCLKPLIGGSHEEFSPPEAAAPKLASKEKSVVKKSTAAKVAKKPFEENKSPLSRAMKRLEDTNSAPLSEVEKEKDVPSLKRRASMELPIPTSALKKTPPPSTAKTQRRKSRVWGNDDSNVAAAKAVALATAQPSPKKVIDPRTKEEDAPEPKKRGRKPKAKAVEKTVPVKKTTTTKKPKAAVAAKKATATKTTKTAVTTKVAKKPKAATAKKKSAATPVKATRKSSRTRK